MLRIVGNTYKLSTRANSTVPSIISARRNVTSFVRQPENIQKNVKKINQMNRFVPVQLFQKNLGLSHRNYSTEAAEWQKDPANAYQHIMRNIGISAHIDSGKTTLTERILYYTGRIREIHEVKGKDKVGATMDFMELEREKGITIQSAATYCTWGDNKVNIIDTPGHVDFTIEVERALRVLDGAVLVLCGVSGVQSQTLTVDRQMRRYSVPRLVFINKLDRMGADPYKVLGQLRSKLALNAALITIPIGIEHTLAGVVDLITKESVSFEGNNGERIVRGPIPAEYEQKAAEARQTLLERLADGDDFIAEKVLDGVEPTVAEIREAIKRSVLAHKFTPVLCGSALKNKGVQLLLDAVVQYLPNPMQRTNTALDVLNGETQVELESDVKKPFVGLAFKLEEGRFGQLTYMRVYSGKIQRGEFLYNVNTGKKIKVPRLVRMHANSMEEIDEVGAGEICAMFGVDCASGQSFTNGTVQYTMTSMHIPEPVMSLAISCKKEHSANFSKALSKFQKEDPTFRVVLDPESNQTIIKGMGELHLDIYVERMKREYGVEAVTGRPQVAYRETITKRIDFEYTHKKQSGGAGQYAKVIGYLEPIPEEEKLETDFVDSTVGTNIPINFKPAIQKGYLEAVDKGPQIGVPVTRVRMVITDGAAHPVDSNEISFRTASAYGFRDGFKNGGPVILEPIMTVEITAPAEFQGTIMGGLNKRKGVIQSTDTANDTVTVIAEVPLNNMFGYSSDLRSCTQGKGEFVMEYTRHLPVPREDTNKLIAEFAKKKAQI